MLEEGIYRQVTQDVTFERQPKPVSFKIYPLFKFLFLPFTCLFESLWIWIPIIIDLFTRIYLSQIVPDYQSTTHKDYETEFVSDWPEPETHHNLLKELPVSYWTDNVKKGVLRPRVPTPYPFSEFVQKLKFHMDNAPIRLNLLKKTTI